MLGAHGLDGEAGGSAFGRVSVVAVDYETVAEAYGSWRRLSGLLQDLV